MTRQYISGAAMRGRVASKERRTYNDVTYDSLGERTRAEELDLLARDGKELTYWLRQVKFRLGPDFWWRADFLCFRNWSSAGLDDVSCLVWVEEVKFYNKHGNEPKDFRTVRRLWAKYGPFPMLIYKRKGNGWVKERLEGAQRPGGGDGD